VRAASLASHAWLAWPAQVAVLESEVVGWGSSGMNGGFLLPMFALDVDEMVHGVGVAATKRMMKEAYAAQERTVATINKYGILCDLTNTGILTVSFFKGTGEEQAEINEENQMLGTNQVYLSKEQVQADYKTKVYQHGTFEPVAYTLNPLSYMRGLARACEEKGVKIFERTRATRYEALGTATDGREGYAVYTRPNGLMKTSCPTIQGAEKSQHPPAATTSTNEMPAMNSNSTSPLEETQTHTATHSPRDTQPTGECVVQAQHVVLCVGPHIKAELNGQMNRALVKNYTAIVVTKPIGQERLRSLIKTDYAVCDTRCALGYYRPLPDSRLLYGGLCSAIPFTKDDIVNALTADLVHVYPELADVEVDFAWTGPMAWARHEMPLYGKLDDGVYYVNGLGGDGLNGSAVGGDIIATAIANGDDQRIALFQDNYPVEYAYWPFGGIGTELVFRYYRVMDALTAWRDRL
ncbi:hypothetical protein, variant, partial [Sphaeroforma arctica JP610]